MFLPWQIANISINPINIKIPTRPQFFFFFYYFLFNLDSRETTRNEQRGPGWIQTGKIVITWSASKVLGHQEVPVYITSFSDTLGYSRCASVKQLRQVFLESEARDQTATAILLSSFTACTNRVFSLLSSGHSFPQITNSIWAGKSNLITRGHLCSDSASQLDEDTK